MSKLLEHFKVMQGMAARYLDPAPYSRTFPDPGSCAAESGKLRMDFFVSDMLHMLDGPEQRATEADEAAREAASEAKQAEWRMDIRKQVEQADTIANKAIAQAKEMEKRNADLQKDNNTLRDMLMRSELNYAKLRGYLEGKLDSAPPVMVPQERMPFHASMPDASGPSSAGWGQPSWYHR